MNIVKHPASVLKQICEPVTKFDSALSNLAHDMLNTIGAQYEPRDKRRIGVGLAAPQVNWPVRLVVIAAPGFPHMMLANPVITKSKGSDFGYEGCLSLPDRRERVKRAATIVVEYQDLNGNKQSLKAKDFLARVIQHEVDHLDGIEFIDRI